MISILITTLLWILCVTGIVHIIGAYVVWCFLGVSYTKKRIVCLICLVGIFLPDIVFPMTVQLYIPAIPNSILLTCAYISTGLPLLIVPGILLSRRYETAELLAALQFASPLKSFFYIYLPHFLRGMLPVSIVLFLYLFHNFSLPALCEIELVPNYLFAEFNTFYSFTPFFRKMMYIVPVVLSISFVYYLIMAPKRYMHSIRETISPAVQRVTGGVGVLLLWFLTSVAFPAVFWLSYTVRDWHHIDWAKVMDCWFFSSTIAIAVAGIAVAFSVLLLFLKKRGVKTAFISVCTMYACGHVMLAVFSLFVFGYIEWLKPFRDSSLPMIFTFCLLYVPLAVALILLLRQLIHTEMMHAANLFFKRQSQRIRYVIFPLVWPGILAVVLLIFNFVGKDVDAGILLVPPGKSFLPVRLHLLLHYGDFPTLGALVLVYLTLILLTVFIIHFCVKHLFLYGMCEN